EPVAARCARSALAGRTATDSVSRRVRVFRARSVARAVGAREDVGRHRDAPSGRLSRSRTGTVGGAGLTMSVDDPFRPSDSTVVRPRPGAGKRSGGFSPDPSPLRAFSDVTAVGDAIPVVPGDVVVNGLSPLVQAASPLLQLAAQLRGTV